jgi:hypothetical protein
MDSSLLQKNSLAFNQAAPLPYVRSTKLIIWRREFIIVAIERLSAILPKNDTRNSGRCDGKTRSKAISGTSSGWNLRRRLLEYECISPPTMIISDILYTIYLGILKHLIDWVTSFLEQHPRIDKFN